MDICYINGDVQQSMNLRSRFRFSLAVSVKCLKQRYVTNLNIVEQFLNTYCFELVGCWWRFGFPLSGSAVPSTSLLFAALNHVRWSCFNDSWLSGCTKRHFSSNEGKLILQVTEFVREKSDWCECKNQMKAWHNSGEVRWIATWRHTCPSKND